MVQLIYQVMFDVSESQVTFPMLFHVSGRGKKVEMAGISSKTVSL